MSKPTRIALVGATGLIGMSLIRLAVHRPDIRIIAISRREVPLPPGARMEVLVADTTGWADAIAAANADALACALGTTWKKSGKDEAAFRAVDHDLVLACGQAAKAAGLRQMIAVSSVGADPLSKNRYLRTKGEAEQELGRLGLTRLDILRPGLLRGPRQELRVGERIASMVSPLTDLLLHGKYSKYRSIRAETMAEAIVGLTREKMAGRFVLEHDAILRAARKGQAML
ncbi:MAG: NAD(P)H-binding protein [Novosphingobium sp.]